MKKQKKTRHQLIAEVTALTKELKQAREQIIFLQGSISNRNRMMEAAERKAKVAAVSKEAIEKLYLEQPIYG